MQSFLFFSFSDHWSILHSLELGLAILISRTSPEKGRYELHWLCALHLRAMNCFARLDLRVCMRDGPTGRDRSINSLFEFFSCIRPPGSVNRRLSSSVGFTSTYVQVQTSAVIMRCHLPTILFVAFVLLHDKV